MFFTQEDYKKIQQWLLKHSIKDTEFTEATTPFNGNETITIVQNNQNRRALLKHLNSEVFSKEVPDLININDTYNTKDISLQYAINLIPQIARREGQLITFTDRNKEWKIFQFKGTLNQWNDTNLWSETFGGSKSDDSEGGDIYELIILKENLPDIN